MRHFPSKPALHVFSVSLALLLSAPALKGLAQPAAKGPILRGRIVDADGHPLADVRVVLYSGVATRFRGQVAATNADGEYRFDPLTTGALMATNGVGALYTGMQLVHPTHVPADGQSWRDVTTPTTDGEQIVDLVMKPGGKIRGLVTDADNGRPASKLSLRIHDGFFKGGDDGQFHAYAATDAAGKFESEPLFPGRYVLEINGDRYAKIGQAAVHAGETVDLKLTTRERSDLQDPFSISGTARAVDGKSMVYGGVGLRLVGEKGKGMLRTKGGGIDGGQDWGLTFGPVERSEPTPKSPYGVGTHDVELVGYNSRFGYKLVRRIPSEPLRITDDPSKPELEAGVRYIRPNQPMAFELIFAKE